MARWLVLEAHGWEPDSVIIECDTAEEAKERATARGPGQHFPLDSPVIVAEVAIEEEPPTPRDFSLPANPIGSIGGEPLKFVDQNLRLGNPDG
jgi:hypothetical protein